MRQDAGVAGIDVGRVVVTRNDDELPALDELLRRGRANGVQVEAIDESQLHELEPLACTSTRALWSPTTGVAANQANPRSRTSLTQQASHSQRFVTSPRPTRGSSRHPTMMRSASCAVKYPSTPGAIWPNRRHVLCPGLRRGAHGSLHPRVECRLPRVDQCTGCGRPCRGRHPGGLT